MNKTAEVSISGLITGTLTSVLTASALIALAKSEGRSGTQPFNATSHWYHGEQASSYEAPIWLIPGWVLLPTTLRLASGPFRSNPAAASDR